MYDNELRRSQNSRAAESGAVGAACGRFDADLQSIIDAWPTLPAKIKAMMVATAKSAVSPSQPKER